MAGFSWNEKGVTDITCFIPASADLSGNQYHFVRIDASETDNEIELVASAGGQALGVLQDEPKASTAQYVRVRVIGPSLVVCGDTVTRGDDLQSLGDGEADTAASGDHVLGYALESGVDQSLIHAIIKCPGGQLN